MFFRNLKKRKIRILEHCCSAFSNSLRYHALYLTRVPNNPAKGRIATLRALHGQANNAKFQRASTQVSRSCAWICRTPI